jgi:hypothetical protein
MTHALLVFACVLQSVEGGAVDDPRCDTAFVHQVVAAINKESATFDVPKAIIASVIYHESRYKKNAKGSKGEVGLMQVKRGGAIQGKYRKWPFAHLAEVNTNIHIGVAYMAEFNHKCPTASQWLTIYNQGPGKGRCKAHNYSRGVLKDLARGRRIPLGSGREERSSIQSTWVPPTEQQPGRTSYTGPDLQTSIAQDTRDIRPAGTRRGVGTMEQTQEELLSVPFSEP